jgi:ribosomal protein S3AE
VLEDDAFYHYIYPIDNVMVAAVEWFKQNEQNEAAKNAEATEATEQEETKNKE